MIKVTSFYKFFPLSKKDLKNLKTELFAKGKSLQIRGLIILGEEGINATLSGYKTQLEAYKKEIDALFNQSFSYKDSFCKKWNFKLLSIKIKDEIVYVGKPYPHLKERNQHLSPKEWEQKLNQNVQVLDVRNDYEINIGKFKNAQDLKLKNFSEFPQKIDQMSLNKNQETLIYCTGGIRCEKALEIMKEKGFKQVYQLQGGILNYLKEYPHSQFKDQCFVFDHRVSLDQSLTPSIKYTLCPHCGQPANVPIDCSHCGKPATVCTLCLNQSRLNKTCSKNCIYHFEKGHQCKKKYTPSAALT